MILPPSRHVTYLPQTIFVTGGTGYIGRALLPLLVARGHHVLSVVRPGAEARLPSGVRAVVANALRTDSFQDYVTGASTFIQLLGVRQPSPFNRKQFRAIDLVSVDSSVKAAKIAGVRHFIYMSVARPGPVMHAYQEARREGEMIIRDSGLPATFLRPWYVLGPAHRWPLMLLPLYWLLEHIPATRERALRIGLVKLPQMIAALLDAVENPPIGIREISVPEIRAIGRLYDDTACKGRASPGSCDSGNSRAG